MRVSNSLRVGYDELSPRDWRRLKKSLTFVNGKGETILGLRDHMTKGYARIPRGAWYLPPLDSLDYTDSRVRPVMPALRFALKLDDLERDKRFEGQTAALGAMLEHEQGQIIRPPGTGKTQIALAFIAACETRTLVLVHTEDILDQWRQYAEKAIPDIDIGVIRGKTFQVEHLTLSTVQTFVKHIGNKELLSQFGAVIADESHHGAANTWDMILNAMPAFYRFGFTASPTRADGMHPALKFLFGPVLHRKKFTSPIPLTVVPVKTKFYFGYRGQHDWTNMVTALTQDEARNKQIAKVADREIEKGNSVLILSRRIGHLEAIAKAMSNDAEILTGARRSADRKSILTNFRSGKVRCLLATQLADEALDVPILNRVLLVHPGKHEGRIIQQIGRAIRKTPDKKDAVIYDFVDKNIRVLRRQFNERKRTYRMNNIKLKSSGRLKIGD